MSVFRIANCFKIRVFLFVSGLVFSIPTHTAGLDCSDIYNIQSKFLKNHILFSRPTKEMEQRSLDQFIKNLDPEKVYFLQADINQIRRKNKKFFSNLRKQNCSGLYFVYDVYRKRVLQRVQFGLNYLSGNFQLNKNLTYTLDSKSRKRSQTSEQANNFMKRHLQYQVSSVFLTEEDLGLAVKHIRHILETFKARVISWKPHLNKRELRQCQVGKKQKDFKTCKPAKWLARYLDSYAQSLDSHSSYLDNDDMEEFKISMELKLEGIGATLSSSFGYTVVENLIEGGAAFRAGTIKVKDKILAVGQTRKKIVNIFGEDLQDVVSLIRGKKGTPVYLKILREEKGKTGIKKKIFTAKIIRDTVNLKEKLASLTYVDKKIKGKTKKIALINVPSFYGSGSLSQQSVGRDVRRLLRKAKKERAAALVLDLSNNRGGPLDEAVDLAGFFFARGHVVKQSERDTQYRILSDRDRGVVYTGPLVILVNRLSASASEIVSGTLKNYNRAVIVGGEHTFGKGSVQSVELLPFNLGAIKTTIGLYFIPSGHSTQKNGVYSHISFPSVLNIEELGEKNLDHALPRQKIPSFKSGKEEIFSLDSGNDWQPVSSSMIEELKTLSYQRISQSRKFQDIRKKLEKFKKTAEQKKIVTIGEVLEKEEKDSALKEKKEKEAGLKDSKLKKQKKYLARADVEEALNIAADLANLYEQKQRLSLK